MSTPVIRASGFDGSRVTVSAGATKTLYRRVATSQIGPSEAGRKRAIKGNNSGGGHIVPRASAGFPWDDTAASYATRAIMNDEIASRSRSDTNFPERPRDEEMKFLSGNLFKWQCLRFFRNVTPTLHRHIFIKCIFIKCVCILHEDKCRYTHIT